jgi:hypothetical protein
LKLTGCEFETPPTCARTRHWRFGALGIASTGEALKVFEETVSLWKSKHGPDDPDTPLAMRGVAKSLITVHRGAEAVPVIRADTAMWEKLKRTDPDSLYKAASFRALTAAALRAADKSASADHDADPDRAMAWLKQAVAAGYSQSSV